MLAGLGVWLGSRRWRSPADPLNRRQLSPVSIARLDCVPLPGDVLEPAPPLRRVRTVLGVTCSIFSLDEPEALPGEQAEGVGVVVQGPVRSGRPLLMGKVRPLTSAVSAS